MSMKQKLIRAAFRIKNPVDKGKRKIIEDSDKAIRAQETMATGETLRRVSAQTRGDDTSKIVSEMMTPDVRSRQKQIAIEARKKLAAYRKRTGK